jgi:hypothetical protein
MRSLRPRPRRRRSSAGLLALPVLLLHLLIPAGFMPADDALLSLQICPEGLPPALHAAAAHHHHHGGGGHGEHCVFGLAGASGPPSQHPPAAASRCAALLTARRGCTPIPLVRLVHLPAARGPPALV